jgi:hypothetical protein
MYNSPTGCVTYKCNENLPDLIAADDQAVQDALALVRSDSSDVTESY